MTRLGSIVIAVASLVLPPFVDAHAERTDDRAREDLPALILWAWERPEDLRFLDPKEVGVAFLADTITLLPPEATPAGSLHEAVIVRPRLEPLQVSTATALVAVVRIETASVSAAARRLGAAWLPTDAQREAVVRTIAERERFPGVRAIQIDFDARRSELGFYRALLEDLRRRLRPTTPLSITALASWCLGDAWLGELPAGTIDEAVPMLFRMGRDENAVASWIRSGRGFTVPACRSSVGLSTDEPLSRAILSGSLAPDGRTLPPRVYVFHPRPWKSDVASAVLAESRRRHER